MRAHLPAGAGVFLCAVALAAWTLRAAAQAPAPLPLEPLKDSGQSMTGAFEGWYENADGTLTLLVGYFNRNRTQTLDIPVGPNNRIEPGDPDRGQPTHFLPRRQWGVFTITVPKDFGKNRLTWTIVANGQTTVIPMHLDPLWIVEPLKDAGIGNTPPSVRFEPGGPAYQGPPDKAGPVLAARANQPLPLTVWVSDDGIRPPEARPRPGPPATVSWSKYRGPGPVTFEKAAPVVDEKDGNATTTATFTVPGEYVLRLQANDQSGNGGGGFQCCWTNVHVKVSVR
jgi:hypothetical protein